MGQRIEVVVTVKVGRRSKVSEDPSPYVGFMEVVNENVDKINGPSSSPPTPLNERGFCMEVK